MGFGDTFNFYAYNSDDGTAYAVKLSAQVASQGGFGTVVSPITTKVWPYHSKNLRHVYGKDSSGFRTRLPLSLASDSKFVSGGSFSLTGRSYTIEGAIGEKRKLNSIA